MVTRSGSSPGHTSALSDLVVTCACGLTRSMAGAFDLAALRGVRRCSGSRPWLSTSDAHCDKELRTLQRGSSNVWFAVSALGDLDPVRPQHRGHLRRQADAGLQPGRTAEEIAGGSDLRTGAPEDLVRAIDRWRNPAASEAAPSDRELRAEEYTALVRGVGAVQASDQFLCEEVDLVDSDVPELVAQVSRVGRLREVRALTGFTRVVPSTEENDVAVAPLVDCGHPVWLPAIEVFGEGVFFRLDEGPSRRLVGNPSFASVEAAAPDAIASERRENSLTSGLDVSPRVVGAPFAGPRPRR